MASEVGQLHSYMSANSLTCDHSCYDVILTALGSGKSVCLGLQHKYGNPSKVTGSGLGSVGWKLDDGR